MALLFISSVHKPEPWLAAIGRLMPELEIRVWPAIGNAAEIDFALAWSPPKGLLGSLPNLKAVSSFGAGVEHILTDPDLPPDLPVLRIVDERLIGGMSEYVLLHALRYHRQLDLIQANQRASRWQWLPPADTPSTVVGIMGLGALGADVAIKLAQIGFRVVGWSQTPKDLPGVACLVGREQLDVFLAQCRILVCLLPLTPSTQGILNRVTFAKLPRGAYLINAARGGHLVEADLLAALADGQIAGATLDVFASEPLPPRHPFWAHPRVLVTPHNAADSIPRSVAPRIVENLRRALAGRPLLNLVDRAKGY